LVKIFHKGGRIGSTSLQKYRINSVLKVLGPEIRKRKDRIVYLMITTELGSF
jgi:hypothetical protein